VNIVQLVAKRSIYILCLPCLLFLLFGETSLTASAASQEVCLPTVSGQLTTPAEQAGTVLINEVLLSSKKPASCPGSTSVPGSIDNSWIELYNPMALSFNLYIVHAAIDGGSGTNTIYFPFGSGIAAHGFLIIFPDKQMILTNGGAETFTRRLLFNGIVIDQVTIPANLGEDQSYARIPDGASKWEVTNTPTIGSSNVLPIAKSSTAKSSTAKSSTTKSSTTTKTSNRISTSVKTKKATVTSTTSAPASTTITSESTTTPAASGIQPAWGQLQFPATPSSPQTTPSALVVSPAGATSNSPPVNNNSDVPRNVLFTGLTLVLIGALFWWGRRRFMRS
jgi:hypothetical protein